MPGRPRIHDHDGTPNGRLKASRAASRARGERALHVTLPGAIIDALDAIAEARGLTRAETLSLLIRDAR
jgi:hypothetical protein